MPIVRSAGKRVWLTGGSLAALMAGGSLGIWAHATNNGPMLDISAGLAPIGTLWINAIRMTVIPLIAAQLVASVVSGRGSTQAGRISGLSVLTFAAILGMGGVLTVAVMPWMLSGWTFTADALAVLRSSAAAPPAHPTAGVGNWLVNLVPSNPFRAAVQDDLLGVMIFSVAFGLAVARMGQRSALVEELARIVADAMMTIIGWIMWIMPIAVFALAISMAARTGVATAQILVAFVILNCVVMFAATLLMYPIGAIASGLPLSRFAAAVLRPQIVAVSTRSSIASLPSMLEAADKRLNLRRDVYSLVLPLAVSVFKANRMISGPLQFLFLAHVYGIDLSAGQIATFLAATAMLSISTLGIPSGGSTMKTMPLYAAVGIPLEGYLLTETVDAVPDIFKTLVNVTGNLTAASVVNRCCARWSFAVAPIAARPAATV